MLSTMEAPEVGHSERSLSEPSDFRYRPVSMLAVVAFVFGLLSAALSLLWFMLFVPVINLFLGTIALLKIRAARGDLGGKMLAATGLVLSVLAIAGGVFFQWYEYKSEVPEGYQRISFSRDISDRAKRMMEGAKALDPQIAAMQGQKIFLKGFMYPVEQQTGLTSFLLVKDSGTCCFGGKPALNDMVGVYMNNNKTANFYSGRVSVAGTFRLNPSYTGANEMEPIFLLDGMTVAKARSDFDPPQPIDFTQMSKPAAAEQKQEPSKEVAARQTEMK